VNIYLIKSLRWLYVGALVMSVCLGSRLLAEQASKVMDLTVAPKLSPILHRGCAVRLRQRLQGSYECRINVGFYLGADLSDPGGLLIGTGKRMRHVKVRPGEKLDSAALRALIVAAYLDVKSRLEK
jgi:hypothetical protein